MSPDLFEAIMAADSFEATDWTPSEYATVGQLLGEIEDLDYHAKAHCVLAERTWAGIWRDECINHLFIHILGGE